MSNMGMSRETLDARKFGARHETIAKSHALRLTPHRASCLMSRTPWPKVKLGEICNIFTGKKDVNQTVANGPYRFFSCAPTLFYSNEYIFDGAAIIVAGNGSYTGRVTYYEGKFDLYQRTYACTITKPHLADIKFVYDVMRLRFQKEIRGSLKGASIPYIVKGHLSDFEIYLPPLPVQRRIADILSAYDYLIENNRRRIAILEETARLAYRKWFVERHFPGHERVSIEDGVPHGWEKVHLGDCVVTNLQSYRASELPSQINYIDISSVKEGRILEKKHLFSHEAPGRARRRARSGDVIWSNVRPNLKSYALILEPEVDDVFSTGFTILTPKSIPYSFLYFFVSTDEFVSYLDNMVTGATYPAVRPGDFEQAELLLPNSELLTRFHTLFEPLLWQCEVLVRQNAALATARDMLLPRLMKGEVNL